MAKAQDQWLSEHDSLDELACEIMHKITQRNQFPKNSLAFTRSNVQVQQKMKNFKERAEILRQKLKQISEDQSITQMEADRRQRLIDNLLYRGTQMDLSLNNPEHVSRSALLGNQMHSTYGANTSNSISSNDNEAETTASQNLNSDEMRQKQQQLMKEQDQGLDTLAHIISRQKYMAQGINSEIDLHNEIIDDIGTGMEQTNERLVRNTRNIRLVSRKSDTCTYWVIIVLLFIAILLVAFV